MIRTVVRALLAALMFGPAARAASIPKPEHPTPDAVRPHWLNLNGTWPFRFDPGDRGLADRWFEPGAEGFDRAIVVPFGWESPLSGIADAKYKGVAWYRRTAEVPGSFPRDGRVWLHFGAVDWHADVWVNGRKVAEHDGGYAPFSADISEAIGDRSKPFTIVVRAFDPTDPSLPTGKQIGWYTPTSGIWQTVWLESRPSAHIDAFTARTKVEPGSGSVSYRVRLAGLTPGTAYVVNLRSEGIVAQGAFNADAKEAEQDSGLIRWDNPKLWTPEAPNLHDATLELTDKDGHVIDSVKTYFGLRSIARGRYGDEPYERLLLNGRPIYLRAALDQSFNPEGVYTAPDDAFLRRDIELAKSVGLNGLRIHIKPDEPRRLYWADRLGILLLEDMPNTWRQDAKARTAWEATMRSVVARDRNHPSIIAWVAFNETWGLGRPADYKADRDTQKWVGAMVEAIRALDPTRLVEDNSPCNYDHVEDTDLNSWHFYIDDPAAARRHVAEVVAKTEPGSGFNYCPGLKQSTAPLINSEYGSVSAGGGDRDVSWGFRDLTTLLRRQSKVQGYVYTELTDIEWEHNGFFNYDRTPKDFGYGAFVRGMTPADLQGADFVGYDGPPAIVVRPGEEFEVPVFVSHFSGRSEPPMLRWTFKTASNFGAIQEVHSQAEPFAAIDWTPYGVRSLDPIRLRAPDEPRVGAVGLTLVDRRGERVAANFVNVVVEPESPMPRVERVRGDRKAVAARFAPGDFARKEWSGPTSAVPGKVTGQGKGFFEYRMKLPESILKAKPESVGLWVEAASRAGRAKVDWPNRVNVRRDYPQTDVRKWPSTLRLTVNGQSIGRAELPDDPSDARGVLSHRKKVDPGSHGELVALGGPLPESARDDLAAGKPLVLRLEVPDDAEAAGGLSLYGAGMGAYPSDPTLLIRTADPIPADLVADPDAPLATDRARTAGGEGK